MRRVLCSWLANDYGCRYLLATAKLQLFSVAADDEDDHSTDGANEDGTDVSEGTTPSAGAARVASEVHSGPENADEQESARLLDANSMSLK